MQIVVDEARQEEKSLLNAIQGKHLSGVPLVAGLDSFRWPLSLQGGTRGQFT